MGNESTSANQIISPPKGGGALHGIGESFSPDLFTGTGNFTVPIAVPSGRNGFQPQLNLVYSTGNGNGPFGFGWSITVPGVSRKTSKGIPQYDDSNDTFILSGYEDLVPIMDESNSGATVYRPRTEGLFARITHYHDTHNDYWEVHTKDGLKSRYGTPSKASADPKIILDPAVVTDPKNSNHVFAWKLTLTQDAFGNRIEYSYVRDLPANSDPRTWDQVYLSEIRYVDYGDDPANPQFLVKIRFTYDGPIWQIGQTPLPPNKRADSFSDYRAGFEIRTAKRCTQIDILTYPGSETMVRSYHLIYQDQVGIVPLNGASLLTKIIVEGHDGTKSELLPPLEFNYTEFKPDTQKFIVVKGADLPDRSLADPNLDLVDLFGQGLPDILEMDCTSVRYWRNGGDGTFQIPCPMQYAPPAALVDTGVQIIDANGDGRADLLVTTPLSGYYPMLFGGAWDKRSFQCYRQAPSFSLKDPQVHLIDFDGDGVTDAIRSGTSLEYYYNDPVEGWKKSKYISGRQQGFPVDFSDPRVKWADMNGDGLQDIVLVYDGVVQYWPNMGYGNWGTSVTMVDDQSKASSRPHFQYGYDPKRILMGDVDGDGLADLVYVDDMKVTLWINQGGNRWSQPIVIEGTPPVSDTDSIRLADLLGNGTTGILWTSDLSEVGRPNMFFLDLTGGVKPYLLSQMNNQIGSVTTVQYRPSTWFYLQDQKNYATRWISTLPFPVQVVASVEKVDSFSGGRLTTEYSYHHGYWDGMEREFRGFGRVDHRDTETFNDNSGVPLTYFSPPIETRTWFHQGTIGDSFEGWAESDSPPASPVQKRFRDEYYQEPWPGGVPPSAQVLSRPDVMKNYIKNFPAAIRRDAFRSMRGKILRTELYAFDGTSRQNLPYTVTEHVYGVKEKSPPGKKDPLDRLHIFFPFVLSERTTQWERGNDPLSIFTFKDNCTLSGSNFETADYDEYGQMLSQISVAVPRGRTFQQQDSHSEQYLATQTVTTYAQSDDPSVYIVDHIGSSTTYEISNDGSAAILEFVRQIQSGSTTRNVVSKSLNFYDGDPHDDPNQVYNGLPFGKLGNYGVLTKTESLVLTETILQSAYGTNIPPYLSPTGSPNWTREYPPEFRNLLATLAGYIYQSGGVGSPYEPGFYVLTERRKYDFQDTPIQSNRGLLKGQMDALGHETKIAYDSYDFLPLSVTNATNLTTFAQYDYRIFQTNLLTDYNGSRISYTFTPLGLLQSTCLMGKVGENIGDTQAKPSLYFDYDFQAFLKYKQPISVKTTQRVYHVNDVDIPSGKSEDTMEKIEYSDGFGRLVQNRVKTEDLIFGDPVFGDGILPINQSAPIGDIVGTERKDGDPLNVVVSGWQKYDNKGKVVEKYEPFFSQGWSYNPPNDSQLGEKISFYYDPVGRVIKTINPDNSEKIIIYGIPPDLTKPDMYTPTPWESYAYDENDNAGRTHGNLALSYQVSWNTPISTTVDSLGRKIKTIERNGSNAASWYATIFSYDVRGNLLSITDPSNRIAFRYVYDLAKKPHVLRTESIDSGINHVIFDSEANVIEARNSNGALILHSYDILNRPVELWTRDASDQPMGLREVIVYGDDQARSGLSNAQAKTMNLLGKIYQHYDESGLVSFISDPAVVDSTPYDFKGNVLEKVRVVINDASLLTMFENPSPNWQIQSFRADWQSSDLATLQNQSHQLLDNTEYRTSAKYDAINRVRILQYPLDVNGVTRKNLNNHYNKVGLLDSVQFDGTIFVENISYNARGQRILIVYGNGVMTCYVHDQETFRLARMRTGQFTNPTTTTYRPSGKLFQDFSYEYDLIGNIVTLHDRSPSSGIKNTPLGTDALDKQFTYDPLYRLLSATGREFKYDLTTLPQPWSDSLYGNIDVNFARSYVQEYRYDKLGKILELDHQAGAGGFTRNYVNDPNSNQITQMTIGANNYNYVYNNNGNITQESTMRFFEWDYRNRMKTFRIQPNGAEPSIYGCYLYDSSGNRVKKLVRKQGGYPIETTVYIDEIFEHCSILQGKNLQQNNLFHIMDEKRRIVIVRAGDLGKDTSPKIKYQIADHLDSCTIVLDDLGSPYNYEEYTPYGETSFGGYAKKRYRFSGKERDEENGLYYYGARYYAPWLAQWISCDPIGFIDGLNIYLYLRDNPICYQDPSGTQAIEPTANEIQAQASLPEEHSQTADNMSLSVAGVTNGDVAIKDPIAGTNLQPVVAGRHNSQNESLSVNPEKPESASKSHHIIREPETVLDVVQGSLDLGKDIFEGFTEEVDFPGKNLISEHMGMASGAIDIVSSADKKGSARVVGITAGTTKVVAEVSGLIANELVSRAGGTLVGLTGAVKSGQELYEDWEHGDVLHGIGHASETLSGVMQTASLGTEAELGTAVAELASGTALATGAALLGAFAVGWKIGTFIDEHWQIIK